MVVARGLGEAQSLQRGMAAGHAGPEPLSGGWGDSPAPAMTGVPSGSGRQLYVSWQCWLVLVRTSTTCAGPATCPGRRYRADSSRAARLQGAFPGGCRGLLPGLALGHMASWSHIRLWLHLCKCVPRLGATVTATKRANGPGVLCGFLARGEESPGRLQPPACAVL